MGLSKQEKELLSKAYTEIRRKYTRALLPEEEALLEKQWNAEEDFSSPGYHIHDETNPTGKHRHHIEDTIDGEHRHTFINPEGEHVHGNVEGMALADGGHYHDWNGLGWHHHDECDDNSGTDLIPEKPDSVL